MAVESRIDADDEWFVGEDRLLRFQFVEGDTSDIDTWSMVFELFPRRASADAAPLLSVPAVGILGGTEPDAAVVTITGDTTTTLGPGIYQFVLRRTDVGLRSVLSFGPAELRTAVNA